MICKWMMKKYGLKWTVHPSMKTYILRLRSGDTDRFLDIVSPYQHKDLAYKFIRISQVNRTSAVGPEMGQDIVRSCGKPQETGIKSLVPPEMVSNNNEFNSTRNCINSALNAHRADGGSNSAKFKYRELLGSLNKIISSQANQECLEGSTTKVWSPERTVKPQERGTPA